MMCSLASQVVFIGGRCCVMVRPRDSGHLRTGADARKTGGTAEGRRDGTGQTPSIGGLKGRLNAPQNAPRLKQGKLAKLLI
jgi:hypothetical protein